MAKPGPQKINRYGDAFKLQAVQMSNVPGVLIKDVAESLCIHPFMLSRWRKQVRDGVLTGKPPPLTWPLWANCSGCASWNASTSSFRWSTPS